MVSFEIFVTAMPPSLSEFKVLPSFYFAFKIPDDVAASSKYHYNCLSFLDIIEKVKFSSEKSFLIQSKMFQTYM